MAVAPVAIAHGVIIQHQATTAIEITASFDNGEPMRQAQVLVYTPDDPAEPWLKGTTDDRGQFTFTPTADQPGNWEVTVRQAGHGDVAIIPVGEDAIAAAGDNTAVSTAELSPLQQGIMMGSVIWGFVGTALFFSRGKR